LVETGIPGFLLFFGAIAAGVWSGVREYLSDGTERGGLAGGLACALLAYAIYRLVLSQQESQTLLYLFIGALMALARVKRDQHENETNRRVSGSPRSQRPDNHVQQ
jgi:O-antigen ligase